MAVYCECARSLSWAKYMIAEIDRFLPERWNSLSMDTKHASFTQAFENMAYAFIADDIGNGRHINIQ